MRGERDSVEQEGMRKKSGEQLWAARQEGIHSFISVWKGCLKNKKERKREKKLI